MRWASWTTRILLHGRPRNCDRSTWIAGKQNLYQHTWRVPFIVKGPGIQAGARVEGNIYLLDVLATLCDLSGIAVPDTNEG